MSARTIVEAFYPGECVVDEASTVAVVVLAERKGVVLGSGVLHVPAARLGGDLRFIEIPILGEDGGVTGVLRKLVSVVRQSRYTSPDPAEPVECLLTSDVRTQLTVLESTTEIAADPYTLPQTRCEAGRGR